MSVDCYACGRQADPAPPPRDDVLPDSAWQVAHAFNSTLPGWLVVLPRRHVTAITDLTDLEADELGGLLVRLSRALTEVTGCAKTYQMQFSEAEGFAHLHIHLVPRMDDQPDGVRGPQIFAHLVADEAEWLPEAQRDRIALAIRSAVAGG